MSAVEKLKDRIIEMIDQGCTRFGWTVGPQWHSMPIEEKAETILQAWDAPKIGKRKHSASVIGDDDVRNTYTKI